MDHKRAQEITEAYKPSLVFDAPNPTLPAMFVVRRKAAAMPFSIHLPTDTVQDEEAPAREEQAFKDALDAADRTLPVLPDADPA